MLLQGKKALVTGAGKGIGTTIARMLASEGAAVALAYRGSREGAEQAAGEIEAAGGRAVALQADLTSAEDCQRLAAAAREALGGLDILVNNAAGFGPLKLLADSEWQDIDDEWNAVTRPVVTLTHAVLPGLIAQRYGRVVSLTAALVHRPAVRYGAHTMAKSAVLAFTRTLAREVGPYGVTVNAVAPGTTLTEFSQTLPQATRDSLAQQTPLRRLAEPEDVARAVLFFCSPLADFVTGGS